MSVLDVNKDITEESLKSIGFFRAAYDVNIEIIDIREWIKVPSYLKFISFNTRHNSNGFISVRYIPYLKELTISYNNFSSDVEMSVKNYENINDIDEINILIHQYTQLFKSQK